MAATKTKLLKWLKKNQHHWVSGEEISKYLGISRAAIWKQINNLKNEGYIIQSASKKGYRLEQATELLLPDKVQEHLQTRIMGRPKIVYLKETDSTNLLAKSLASQGAAEGTLILAETQTAGRGRMSRTWFSPPEQNIYASIILRPPIIPSQAPQITLMTAVAAAKTLKNNAQLNARIKWPNDILIHGKKIAGILTEISTDMDMINYVIVGLGMNINTAESDLPPEIKDIATSVLIQNDRPFSRVKLLCAFLKNFEIAYEQLTKEGFTPVMDQWRQMSDIIGRKVLVDVINSKFKGVVESVDHDGVLNIKDDQGQMKRVFSGDVTYI